MTLAFDPSSTLLMYNAVVSPSIVGLVAMMTSLTPSLTRSSSEEMFNLSRYPVNTFSILGLANKEAKESLSLVIELKKDATLKDEKSIREYIETINNQLDMTQRVKNIYFTFDQIKNPNAIKPFAFYSV